MRRPCLPGLTLLLAAALAAAEAPRPSTASDRVEVLSPPLLHPALPFARSLRIYLPPGYAASDRDYPVIYLPDGQNLFNDATSYVGEWGVDEALDALAAEGFEAIAVGIDHGGERRMQELSPWHNPRFGEPLGAAYLDYLVETVKPFVDANYRTLNGPESTAIVGSSMGGLMAHYALHARPEVFGLAGVLSPSYWYHEAAFHYPQNRPRPAQARVFLSMGGAEGHEAVAHVEAMERLLRRWPDADGVRLRIVEAAEHNEAQWRTLFPEVVRFLYRLPPAQGG
ncbi:alpha/beta hydrolase [Pseudomarimonas salicorniae]|uniref:Alpha/beta hydrolase-fold protein n=1 Tax=Pseudomarimonas salicorniae TaxID=2933270 RepID=A0ABT0GIQ3_9GAMM|nr:alpha/beta hydrolase-fold protein [Lysobacter sp. CAU 1642]MCK7594313.1 alpha/beta hydrolase-fold protein [Lysobacter sp. CAU 1642]